jgi:3-hydroxyisobutyrate dehydrogenase-like beta-hydroxyacid dehydrogenase
MAVTEDSVSVVGLGLMGSSLAQALVASGYPVTVWNRSTEKANKFKDSATIAPSLLDACTNSNVIVLCLLTYEDANSLLRNPETEAALSGKVLIQLTTGTPEAARLLAAWADTHEIVYLDGVITVFPSRIGAPDAQILYAGSAKAYEQNHSLLQVLAGQSVFVGGEVGKANALDMAMLEMFYGSYAVVYHSLALCAAESVALSDLLVYARGLFNENTVAWITKGVESGIYPAGHATMYTHVSWVRQLIQTAKDVGLDTSFPSALLQCMDRTIDLGHGDDDFQAMYEAFKPREQTVEDQRR